MQQPKYTMHGQWHKSPDVVECAKLVNMLHSEFVIREDIAFILMLSSVITCPSMTSLFRDLLKSALLQQQNTDVPRDAALDIMAQFHENGLPAIAKQEIEAFTINSWRDMPSALHIDRVVSGFRSNRGKIVKFCQKTGGGDHGPQPVSRARGVWRPKQQAQQVRWWVWRLPSGSFSSPVAPRTRQRRTAESHDADGHGRWFVRKTPIASSEWHADRDVAVPVHVSTVHGKQARAPRRPQYVRRAVLGIPQIRFAVFRRRPGQ